MKQKIAFKRKINLFITQFILALGIILYSEPTKAFVPYFYKPNSEELKKTSINIAKTAAQLIHLGQPKEAMRLALLAVSLEPNDERLWGILAETQTRMNLIDKAIESLSKAKRINPTNPSIWFAEATLELQKNRSKNAIKLLRIGLKYDKSNAGAYFQLGNARIMEKQPNLALIEFEKAIKIESKFWEAINNQGIILFELDKIEKAIVKWRKVLEIKKNAEPMLALATALNLLNPNNSESIDLAKEALTKNPNYVFSIHQQKQLWGYKLRKAAKKLLNKQELLLDVKKAIANSDISINDDK